MGPDMKLLKEILLRTDHRNKVIDDCVDLIEMEVAGKKGLSGMAVKGIYSIVKKIRPGMVRGAVNHLLDSFVEELETFYEDWQTGSSDSIEVSFKKRANDIADRLLTVTDRRAARARNRTLKNAYAKLRPRAVKHTAAAVPGIGRIIAKYH